MIIRISVGSVAEQAGKDAGKVRAVSVVVAITKKRFRQDEAPISTEIKPTLVCFKRKPPARLVSVERVQSYELFAFVRSFGGVVVHVSLFTITFLTINKSKKRRNQKSCKSCKQLQTNMVCYQLLTSCV